MPGLDARRTLAGVGLVLLACNLAGPGFGAEPAIDKTRTGIVISDGTGSPTIMTAAELALLPSTQVTLSLGSGPDSRKASFEGPRLWSLLDHAAAVHPDKPHGQVRQLVLITGHDGYTAVLALGEIAPEFEGKPVILADRMDGQPLAAGHFRIVVPGDSRAGRSVRDIASITVMTLRP